MRPFRRILTVASAVLVSCSLGCSGASGDSDSPESSESSESTPLRVFLTESPYDIGGGIPGADAHCMSDEAHPGDGTFKALIGGASRSVCPMPNCEGGASPQNWVLASNTTYERLDGTTLFTTGEMPIFTDWPMDGALTEAGTSQASALNTDWTVRESLHCED